MKLNTHVAVYAVVLGTLGTAGVLAKRSQPPDVRPLVHEGTRYVAPNDDGRRAYVQAWDVVTTNKQWEVTVFTNRIDPRLEEDVQWIFITRLRIEAGKLVVTDEGDRRFAVDLKTRSVERRPKVAKDKPENVGMAAPDSPR